MNELLVVTKNIELLIFQSLNNPVRVQNVCSAVLWLHIVGKITEGEVGGARG